MNASEHIHECVGCWTDDCQWQITPGEPIVRCKDCKLYDREDGLCCRDPDHSGCCRPAHDDGFCAWGEPVEEAEDAER